MERATSLSRAAHVCSIFCHLFCVLVDVFSRRETRLLKSHSPDENRFGMMQLMLFVTFFALGMGLRAFVWS